MKYRIIKKTNYSYRVQCRANWWPFWSTDKRFKLYDKPKRRERHGGLFGDIITKETIHGYHTSLFRSESEAKERIEVLKSQEQEKKNRKSAPKPQVIYTE